MSMLLPAPFSPMSAWHLALRHRERNTPQRRRRAEILADIMEEEVVGHWGSLCATGGKSESSLLPNALRRLEIPVSRARRAKSAGCRSQQVRASVRR